MCGTFRRTWGFSRRPARSWSMYGVTIYILPLFRVFLSSAISLPLRNGNVHTALSTAISVNSITFSCLNDFNNLISRNAVMGNYSVRTFPAREAHSFFFIVHENLL